MNSAERKQSRERRGEHLKDLMERLSTVAIVLRRYQNFAWYTCGGDNRVDHASPIGVAAVVLTRDGEYVLTNNIEAGRMRAEQTPDMTVVEHPWFADSVSTLRDLCGAGTIASDAPQSGETDASTQIAHMRLPLSTEAIEQYRGVGTDTFAAMQETAAEIRPGMTEFEAIAILKSACIRRRMSAPVAMAASDDRIHNFRHPIPSDIAFQRRVMLVVCAERGGLYGNLTHFVDFEEPAPIERRHMELSAEILRRMRLEATRAGRTLADVFYDCRTFYAECGYPEEWRLHHQGGLTGYASREVIATFHTVQPIEIGQAFAWNPSITGGKAEETFVLTRNGAEVLTRPSGH